MSGRVYRGMVHSVVDSLANDAHSGVVSDQVWPASHKCETSDLYVKPLAGSVDGIVGKRNSQVSDTFVEIDIRIWERRLQKKVSKRMLQG